jgi:hypothetical protein
VQAKDFLKQVEKIDSKIKNKLIEQQQWRYIASSITANVGGEKVQSSGSQQKMANAIEKCVDMEREITALIDELVDTKREVIAIIEQVDSPIEYDVLHKIYIQYMTFQEVADYYGREYGWATTTHGRAKKSVQIILDKRNL